ncbi:MAG: hypothetical protein HC824_12195 [Synechococcales cyanobacterium RM1_1_8]|nr:hypothetical protein [Synechococcales cyanobacterium RM1_1_8]
MLFADYWRQKSDIELAIAARQFADDEEEVQQIIETEIRRRGLPETLVLKRPSSQRKADLMGDLIETIRVDAKTTDRWWQWLIGIPLVLGFGILLLLSAKDSFRNLLLGAGLVGGTTWSIFKAVSERKASFSFYEKGVLYQISDRRISAYYNEVELWEEKVNVRITRIPIRSIVLYKIQLPGHDPIVIYQSEIAEKLQRRIAHFQIHFSQDVR